MLVQTEARHPVRPSRTTVVDLSQSHDQSLILGLIATGHTVTITRLDIQAPDLDLDQLRHFGPAWDPDRDLDLSQDQYVELEGCAYCGGSGYIRDDRRCRHCVGTGWDFGEEA